MKGRLPEEILNRSKQAYRAPIKSVFESDHIPEELLELLLEKKIRSAGIFNPKHVNSLVQKMNSNKQISEVDNMALTAILSTQILHDLYVDKNINELSEEDLVVLDKVIID